MNPVKITLLILGIWIVLTKVCVHLIEDVSEKPFEVIVLSFYLAPFICITAFIISAFFFPFWINKHKMAVISVLVILIIWASYIILHIQSLFI